MEHIGNVLGLSQLNEKVDTLKRKLQVLESKEEDIKEELKLAKHSLPTKKPRKEVQNWLAEVERLKLQVQQKEQEVVERSPWCMNPQLGKSVDKLTTEVADLIEQSKFPRGLTLEAYQKEGVSLLTKRLIGETFQKNKNMIWECLTDCGENSIIGIHGMGGVGKTTLLTHIHNQLLEHHINVSWVTVSQNLSIRKLQHDIAKTLHLDISDEEDEKKRAARLASALNDRKNLILILDDLWDPISLDEVGLRVGTNGCKLVLTSRSLIVCRRMSCQKQITIEPLSHEEAWTLFMETLGSDTSLLPQIEETAKLLVHQCGGLPLGIVTIAGSMKGVDNICEWRTALREVSGGESCDMDSVFRVLKYSYDKLKEYQKVQECFLYCSLFPEDQLTERDQLIEYFIDEELIDGTTSRQSKFDKGHTILNKLENVCLLEGHTNANGDKCIKMHDLVRDMAIRIVSTSPNRFLVQAGKRLKDMPTEEKWSEDLVRVSLMRNHISNIPSHTSPRCPGLLTLLLRDNYSLKVIPNNFFVHMKAISILDLSDTGVESLPTSVSTLGSLTALLLGNCQKLRHVPSLETLTALRKLDLNHTSIDEVPRGVEKLTNLRYLNLQGCHSIERIPDGILPGLSHMEYFESDQSMTLKGDEIGSWRKLETFYGQFDHVGDFSTCAKSWEEREPDVYTILVGYKLNNYAVDPEALFNKQAHLFESSGAEDVLVLPTCIQHLSLESCQGIASLSHIAALKKVSNLRKCKIFRCDDMTHVICAPHHGICFPQTLQILVLLELPKLTDLIKRQRSISPSSASAVFPINTFSSLKELKIVKCDELKILFTPTLLSLLQSLERLIVLGCGHLVEIIGETSNENEAQEETTTIISTPPKLRYLNLGYLPELRSFCNCSIKLSHSLEEIQIIHCWKMETITLLWDEPCPHPSLLRIEVHEPLWDRMLAWKHPETKEFLQPYVFYRPLTYGSS